MEGDVEALEMAEQPSAEFQQHPLTGSAGDIEEQHPGDGLDDDHPAQRCHDYRQFAQPATGQHRRDGAVDSTLHHQRDR